MLALLLWLAIVSGPGPFESVSAGSLLAVTLGVLAARAQWERRNAPEIARARARQRQRRGL